MKLGRLVLLALAALAIGCGSKSHGAAVSVSAKSGEVAAAAPRATLDLGNGILLERVRAVIRKLVQSTETQSLQAPIVRLYLSCLDRVPDYEGFDYYTTQLKSGDWKTLSTVNTGDGGMVNAENGTLQVTVVVSKEQGDGFQSATQMTVSPKKK